MVLSFFVVCLIVGECGGGFCYKAHERPKIIKSKSNWNWDGAKKFCEGKHVGALDIDLWCDGHPVYYSCMFH